MKSHEHRSLGDAATGRALVDMGALALTYGDVVALSGDYFSPLDEVDDGLFALAAAAGRGGTRPGTSDEVVLALAVAAADEEWPDSRFERGGLFADHRVDPRGRNEVERRVRDRYLSLAAVNDDHFVAPGRSEGQTGSGAPSAPAAYRRLHQAALDEAWRAGLAGEAVSAAMAREAAAQHYLTDAFASGHLRTPVADIRRYWKARYPEFWDRLQHKVAADTARALRELSGALRLLPEPYVARRTRAELRRRTCRYPELSVGDLVARVFHDWDNTHGLAVEGGHWVFGDGCLEQGDTRAMALDAMQAGIDDVEAAHALGRSGRSGRGQVLYEAVLEATGAEGGRFRAEAYIPRVSDANPAQNWQASSAEDLWESPMVGTSGQTVGQALEEMLAPRGTFIRQLDALGQGLAGGGRIFTVPLIGSWLAGRCCQAFHDGFVEPLSSDPSAAVRSLVSPSGESKPPAGSTMPAVVSPHGSQAGALESPAFEAASASPTGR